MSGEVSRRNFLQKAGLSVAGLAAVGGVGMALNRTMSIGHASAATAPFTYVKLDPSKAAAITFQAYMEQGG